MKLISLFLDVPIFMDKNRYEVNENDKSRLIMKVCTHITHPQLFIVVDKVGWNNFQKCDGRIGEAKNIWERECVPYQQIGNKEKHFTVLGLTNLSGEPVCGIFIVIEKE